MSETLADAFEPHRPRLQALAHRMLGSIPDAEDAVQEAWLRAARTPADGVAHPGAWLTTVTSRICLDVLRSRATRREDPLDAHVPDPVVTPLSVDDPEHHVVLAESVGLALLVVLDALSPAERVAFVLHDIFAMPFTDVAAVLERSPDAAKQLASRARRRVRGGVAADRSGSAEHQQLVAAFLAAARGGDLAGLLAILHPDVVLRADAGAGPLGPSRVVRGAAAVVDQVQRYAALASAARTVRVNGVPGLLVAPDGHPAAVLALTARGSRIVAIDILADPVRLAVLDLAAVLGGDVRDG